MADSKKEKNKQQSGQPAKHPPGNPQKKGAKSPHPTVYDVRTKSFTPVPIIQKTYVTNVIHVTSAGGGPSTSIKTTNVVQQKQYDKPKNQQPNINISQKTSVNNQAKVQPLYHQKKPQVNQPHGPPVKKTIHKHIHLHDHSHTHSNINQPSKTVNPVKTTVHKHQHEHDHVHSHTNRNLKTKK